MKSLIIFLTIAILLSCSSSEESTDTNCDQNENREVIVTFTNARGKIIGPDNLTCPTIFILEDESGEYALPFIPCNLTEAFKEDGLEVIFSGFLYQTFENENVCAFPFELTEISKIENTLTNARL